jgi:hypothetical protein
MSGGAANQGSSFLISDDLDGISDFSPSAGAISAPAGVGEYLVAWGAQASFFDGSVKTRRVTGLGALEGDPVTLSAFEYHSFDVFPRVSGLANNASFEVIWRSREAGRYGDTVIGRGLDANGSLLGPPAWLSGEKIIYSTQIYAGPGGTYLVLYDDFPPDYEHWNLRGSILGLNISYLPLVSK